MITIRYSVLIGAFLLVWKSIDTTNKLVFILSLIGASYLGFSLINLTHDKLIHFATFFILTTEFFFIFRTRSLKQLSYLTFVVCSLCGGIGLEFLQHMVNMKRVFDPMDILCNLAGSIFGLSLSIVYQSYGEGIKKTQPVEIELIWVDCALHCCVWHCWEFLTYYRVQKSKHFSHMSRTA